jgi:hypothetical protein
MCSSFGGNKDIIIIIIIMIELLLGSCKFESSTYTFKDFFIFSPYAA